MNTKSIKYVLAAGLVCCGISTTMISCGNVLDEQPRSTYDPSFFNTPTGIEGGLTALYAHLRYFYGNVLLPTCLMLCWQKLISSVPLIISFWCRPMVVCPWI